jgi:hypothetical protein
MSLTSSYMFRSYWFDVSYKGYNETVILFNIFLIYICNDDDPLGSKHLDAVERQNMYCSPVKRVVLKCVGLIADTSYVDAEHTTAYFLVSHFCKFNFVCLNLTITTYPSWYAIKSTLHFSTSLLRAKIDGAPATICSGYLSNTFVKEVAGLWRGTQRFGI